MPEHPFKYEEMVLRRVAGHEQSRNQLRFVERRRPINPANGSALPARRPQAGSSGAGDAAAGADISAGISTDDAYVAASNDCAVEH